MDTTNVRREHETIKKILDVLKEEMVRLAMDNCVDKTMIELTKDFITHQVHGYHNIKEELIFEVCDPTLFSTLLSQIRRLRKLSYGYFEYFIHYWKCLDEGNTLAKYEVISYGESYVTAMLECMKLEEKLFDLTIKDSIVK